MIDIMGHQNIIMMQSDRSDEQIHKIYWLAFLLQCKASFSILTKTWPHSFLRKQSPNYFNIFEVFGIATFNRSKKQFSNRHLAYTAIRKTSRIDFFNNLTISMKHLNDDICIKQVHGYSS